MVVHNIFVNFIANMKGFQKELLKPQKEFNKLENQTGALNKRFQKVGRAGAKLGRGARFLTAGFRGFRMELLSVMFGAQMVSKAMFGLLKPAMQAVGVFDLWQVLLTTFFLPAAMKVQGWLMGLLGWLDDMEKKYPGFKDFVNVFVLIAGIITALLGTTAALGLFIGGLIISFGTLALVAAFFGVTIGVLIGWVVLIGLAIAALIVGLFLLWKNWDSIMDGMMKLGSTTAKALEKVFSPVGKFIGEKLKVAFDWIAEKVWKPVKKFIDDWIIKPIAHAIDWLAEKIEWLVDKIKNILPKGAKTFLSDFLGTGGEDSSVVPKQSGGYVPHTGLYKLHAGESVNQAGTNNFSPSIVVNASSNVDIEMLKRQLSDGWNDDLSRLGRR